MALPPPVLYNPLTHKPILHQVAEIHAACVLNDHQLVNFLPEADGTMDHVKVLNYWLAQGEQVERGVRFIVLQFTDDSESELAGYVSLSMPPSETGPFRGLVEKLMVSPRHRFKGVARRVMERLEEGARQNGRWLLILDTAIGTAAEHIYPKLGYTEWGVLPNYGISPKDGSLVDERWFYKDLRQSK